MKLSVILPSRNNLKYLKWAYASLTDAYKKHDLQICILDDMSSDGTAEWLRRLNDPNVSFVINESGRRMGITLAYNKLIKEVADNEYFMIFHADMFLAKNSLDYVERYIAPDTIVTLTRIEPPLHPPDSAKIVEDFAMEPEDFDSDKFESYVNTLRGKYKNYVTEGIFAPWCANRNLFLEIGGHDELFVPQTREDSDIFNRFLLYGVKFIQTWEGFVYHLTCRGSRRNVIDGASDIFNDNPEWVKGNLRSTRNFIRKWKQFPLHDEFMKPIVLPVYTTKIIFHGHFTYDILYHIEPFFDFIVYRPEIVENVVFNYVQSEDSGRDISQKFVKINANNCPDTDITVTVRGGSLSVNFIREILPKLGAIVQKNYDVIKNNGYEIIYDKVTTITVSPNAQPKEKNLIYNEVF